MSLKVACFMIFERVFEKKTTIYDLEFIVAP